MTTVKRWGSLSDEKVSTLLRKLIVESLYEPLDTIQAEFTRRSGHRVEARTIPVQECAINLRFCASSLFKAAPLRDFDPYEMIDGKNVEVGLVVMQPDGAVLLQLGASAAALLWKDGDQWVTITDEDLDGKPLHESQGQTGAKE